MIRSLYRLTVLRVVGGDLRARGLRRLRRRQVLVVRLLEVELGEAEHRVGRPAIVVVILGEEVLEQLDRRLAPRLLVPLLGVELPLVLLHQLLALLHVLLLHHVRDGAAEVLGRVFEAADVALQRRRAPWPRPATAGPCRRPAPTRAAPAAMRQQRCALHGCCSAVLPTDLYSSSRSLSSRLRSATRRLGVVRRRLLERPRDVDDADLRAHHDVVEALAHRLELLGHDAAADVGRLVACSRRAVSR